MAAVIVPKNSAANAVPNDASIPPNFHLYIKVTVAKSVQIAGLRHKITFGIRVIVLVKMPNLVQLIIFPF